MTNELNTNEALNIARDFESAGIEHGNTLPAEATRDDVVAYATTEVENHPEYARFDEFDVNNFTRAFVRGVNSVVEKEYEYDAPASFFDDGDQDLGESVLERLKNAPATFKDDESQDNEFESFRFFRDEYEGFPPLTREQSLKTFGEYNGTIRLSVEAGGKPEGADLIQFDHEELKYDGHSNSCGSAYKWRGEFKGERIECDKADTDTFAGTIRWRKYRHADGTEFYFGYGRGSGHSFDHGVIRLAE